jgi:hypothetical protein
MTTQKNFEITFDVIMPGQIKQSQYKLQVPADNRVDALAIAQEEYAKIVLQYDVKIKEVPPVKVAS